MYLQFGFESAEQNILKRLYLSGDGKSSILLRDVRFGEGVLATTVFQQGKFFC